MNYKNNISSKIEQVPRGIQGYGHIIKNVSSKSNVKMDPFKGLTSYLNSTKPHTVCVYLIMGQNMQVDKENKVSKGDGQLNRYM